MFRAIRTKLVASCIECIVADVVQKSFLYAVYYNFWRLSDLTIYLQLMLDTLSTNSISKCTVYFMLHIK